MTQLILAGSYFDNGCKIGQTGAERIKQLLKRDKKLLLSAKKKHRSLPLFLFDKLRAGYGDYLEELRGMALGAGVDFRDLFLENCPEILRKPDGCTSGTVNGLRHRFIIHNEDEDRWRLARGCALAHYQQGKFKYSSFVYFGELAGNAFNWNNRGLFFCVDYMPQAKINPRGMPRYFEARRLLESKNLKESLVFLQKNKSASGFHYLIGDAASKKIVSVEKYLNQASILEVKFGESFCHSNHYIHESFRGKKAGDSSPYRLKIAQENLTPNTSPQEALKIWTTLLRQPLRKNSETKTFATVLADFKAARISIFGIPGVAMGRNFNFAIPGSNRSIY